MRLFYTLCFCISLSMSAWVYSSDIQDAQTNYQVVDTQQAQYLYEQGALFIDVRNDTQWYIGHIKGAVHLDFMRDFEQLYHVREKYKNMALVIYCNSVHCERSSFASAVSAYWGFSKVYNYEAGYFAWQANDLPLSMAIQRASEDETLADLKTLRSLPRLKASREALLARQ